MQMTKSVACYIFSRATKFRPGIEQILRHMLLQATVLTLCYWKKTAENSSEFM